MVDARINMRSDDQAPVPSISEIGVWRMLINAGSVICDFPPDSITQDQYNERNNHSENQFSLNTRNFIMYREQPTCKVGGLHNIILYYQLIC